MREYYLADGEVRGIPFPGHILAPQDIPPYVLAAKRMADQIAVHAQEHPSVQSVEAWAICRLQPFWDSLWQITLMVQAASTVADAGDLPGLGLEGIRDRFADAHRTFHLDDRQRFFYRVGELGFAGGRGMKHQSAVQTERDQQAPRMTDAEIHEFLWILQGANACPVDLDGAWVYAVRHSMGYTGGQVQVEVMRQDADAEKLLHLVQDWCAKGVPVGEYMLSVAPEPTPYSIFPVRTPIARATITIVLGG